MDFGRIGQGASMPDLIDALGRLQKSLDYLMQGGLDSKNIRAKSVQADRMDVDKLSAISADLGTITAGLIIGAMIKTANTGARIEMNGNSLRTYNEDNFYNGPSWGNSVGTNYGDMVFNDAGFETLMIKNLTSRTGWQIGPNSGASMYLGALGLNTVGVGNWFLPFGTKINGVDVVSELNGKASTFSGFSGSVTVVTDVDFGSSSATTSIMNFSNGILTSVT